MLEVPQVTALRGKKNNGWCTIYRSMCVFALIRPDVTEDRLTIREFPSPRRLFFLRAAAVGHAGTFVGPKANKAPPAGC